MRVPRSCALSLSLLAQLGVGTALACQPGTARVRATVPPKGAIDVPIDARIGLWWENYAVDPEFLWVRVEGQEITGTTETLVHEESAGSWSGLTLFIPDDPLPPGARVQARVTSADPDSAPHAVDFHVGDTVTAEALAAPSLLALRTRDLAAKPDAPCGEARRQFIGDVGSPAEATDRSWLLLYRATPDGRLGDWFTILGTADQAPLEFTTSSDELDRELEGECFTVVQLDLAGGRVSSADARCATALGPPQDELDGEAGCSTLPTSARLLWLLTLPALLRRRR